MDTKRLPTAGRGLEPQGCREKAESLRLQVHIRHGDKWREAKETPTQTYFDKARQLQVL